MSSALEIRITLREPLLVTGVANSEENSSIALDYVPGSVLRGALIGAYLRGKGREFDLAGDEAGRSLFFSEEVRFLNGYLAHPVREKRALPRPLSWHMQKDDRNKPRRTLWDFALEPPRPDDPKNPKVEPRAYFWQSDDEEAPLPLASPDFYTNVHNASDEVGKKGVGSSTVFRYEALAAGQNFVAYLVGPEAQLQTLHKLLAQERAWHLGGSRTAGYGWVEMDVSALTDWQEAEAVDEEIEGKTVVTLLSDALLRDQFGQPTTDFNEALGAALERNDLVPTESFARTHLVGGFNRKWGLPLPQQWAVARGSTFVYPSEVVSLADLQQLLDEGIGDRRNEGFGRVGVNLYEREMPFGSETPRASRSHISVELTGASAHLAEQMQQRRAHLLIERAVPAFLAKVDFRGKPRNSQLSRMRQLVRKATHSNNWEDVARQLAETQKRGVTKEQWAKRLTVSGLSFTWHEWLEQRQQAQDGLDLLGIEPKQYSFLLSTAEPDAALRQLATGQLVEAVLQKALKGEQKRNGSSGSGGNQDE